MLDYVFFHRHPFDLFVNFARDKGLVPETAIRDDGFEVRLPEAMEEGLSEDLETEYDRLMDLDRDLTDAEEGKGAHNYFVASVAVRLKNGNMTHAHIDADLLARVMEVLTPQEFDQIVSAIADAVENPDQRSFCKRVRDGDVFPKPP